MTATFEPWDDSLEAYDEQEDYINVLETYIKYVQAKIDINEVPLSFENWIFEHWIELEEDIID